MLKNPDYMTARDLLLDVVQPVGTEALPLSECFGRVLAESVTALENVPPFDRSPYDGYAFRSEDALGASADSPVTLCIIEEVPAGAVPTKTCVKNTAVKLLTGAPIPAGADAVINYERTEFTERTVKLFAPVKSGENIVRAGEDVRKGEVLVRAGQVIDPGTAGTLAAQGIARPRVYRRPIVGVISTGNELAELGSPLAMGQIYDSNRYTLSAALREIGCDSVYLGLAGDCPEAVSALIDKGLASCDAVITTGGVSVGDYDFTPDAMERSGVKLLFRGVVMKPGMACAFGEKDGKLVCGLSGNPASSLSNFYTVAMPALKKLAGLRDCLPQEIPVTLDKDFKKKSPATRLLRGRLDLSDGTVRLILPKDQGNVVISSAIGCDGMAVVPAGAGSIAAGTRLKGFKL